MVRPLYLSLSQYLRQFNHLCKFQVNIYIIDIKIKGDHARAALPNGNAATNVPENDPFNVFISLLLSSFLQS